MLKILIFFLLLALVTLSTQKKFSDYHETTLREIEIDLLENRLTVDELLAEIDDEVEFDNAISETDPSYFELLLKSLFGIGGLFRNEPDLEMTTVEMIEYRGFKAESHSVVTEDCYVLTMHRIVNTYDLTPNKTPILLQHGLFDASHEWIINQIKGDVHDNDYRNLGFALAKLGYDVWLGNVRGNTYSKNHTKFSTKDSNFWRFTFDNHALQDLPAQIAYIQQATNYDQIAYIGFSQGTLTMFELLALKPQVAKVIRPFIALAPVAHLGNLASPLKYLADSKFLMRILHNKNIELLPKSLLSRVISHTACRAFPGIICKNLLFAIAGSSDHQMNTTRVPVYFNHFPAGSSLPNFIHFGQNYRSKKTEMFDYMSSNQNLKCYNSIRPPLFHLEKITNEDIHLLSASNDLLADPADVELLKQSLAVKFEAKIVELNKFGHLDFVLSQESEKYVNNYIIDVLKKKGPLQSVGWFRRGTRLKQFNEDTCIVVDQSSGCHMNLTRTLDRIL